MDHSLKMSVFGVILVRIFPDFDWIRRRRDTDQNNSEYEYISRSGYKYELG